MYLRYLIAILIFLVCPIGVTKAFASCNCLSKPKAVGTIQDQIIFVNGNACGDNQLTLNIAAYFDGQGEPLTYCLSSIHIKGGTVESLNISLNPFNGYLNIPLGWFGVSTVVELKIIAKNPYGSAQQEMKVYLEPCGG